jgi:glycosyltransferase involved in cell wall biosynthesis
MPVALLEAMAYGLAIVATTVGGIPEVAEHEVEALLVEPDDRASLALALGALLADAELRGRLGRAARQSAERLGGTDAYAQLEATYGAVLAPAPDRVPLAIAAAAA